MDDVEVLSVEDATRLIFEALAANGVPDEAARSVANALAAAEAEGQVGHGFSRLEDYVAQVKSGKIAAGAAVRVRELSRTGLLVDAGHGFAYPALDAAISKGVRVARSHGSATMAITRSHHCGALSVQVEKLARHGLVAMMFANSPPAIAPWGAKTPVFGTNPIAFAAPRREADPLVIDLSLSRVARGKVMNAKKSGKPIPEGWALDREGRPTTDPDAALAGSMVPIGEAKGTALALMVEVFAVMMTGAVASRDAASFFNPEGPPPGVGQFLAAFQPSENGDVRFQERLEALLGHIAGLEGARLPGTRRAAALKAARESGIKVPARYVEVARRLAQGAE